jgi:cytochrome c peroxidase
MDKHIVNLLMVILSWTMVTGASADRPANAQSPFFDSVNAFKILSLWGVLRTAPYFHDNSAKTLEAVAAHYAKFFALISTPPGGGDPALVLTEQDQADIVAYMKLLD